MKVPQYLDIDKVVILDVYHSTLEFILNDEYKLKADCQFYIEGIDIQIGV